MNNVSFKMDNTIKWTLLFFFGFISWIGVLYHEPWRDEYQAYLLSYYSHSIIDLFKNTAYEGHPKLWFIILYGIKQISTSIFLVQVIHWAIALGSVYLILFKSNIQRSFVYFIPFGYFFIYEYSAIFRNYAIGILLIFLALTYFQSKKHILFVFFLSLALWSNVFCFILGCSLYLFFLLCNKPKVNKTLLGLSLYFLLMAILAIYTTLPPKDTGFASATEFNLDSLGQVFLNYSRVLFYFPVLKIEAWNTSWFSNYSGPYRDIIIGVISILTFAFFVFYFYRISKKISLLFLVSNFGLFIFYIFKYVGFYRQQGFIYIIIIMCLWIANFIPSLNEKKKNQFIDYPIYLILLFQLASGLYFIGLEYQCQFSQSIKAVSFLKKNKLDQNNIIVDIDYKGSDFCALLQKPIYYCNIQNYGTYTIWNNKRMELIQTDSLLLKDFNRMKNSIFINFSPVNDSLLNSLKFLGKFEPSICGDENYHLYYVKK